MHPKAYEKYLEEKKEATISCTTTKKIRTGLPLSQEEYEATLLNLVVQGMLPLSLVTSDEFIEYTHSKQLFIYSYQSCVI